MEKDGERKLKKIATCLAVVMIAAAVFQPSEGLAKKKTVDDIDHELRVLQQQAKTAKQQKSKAEAQKQEAQHYKNKTTQNLQYVMNQISTVSNTMTKLTVQIDDTQDKLHQTAAELDAAEERIQSREKMLESRVRLMYTDGNVSYLEVLLSSTSFSDFLERADALKEFVDQDKDLLEQHKKDKALVLAKKKELESDYAKAKDLYAQMEDQKAILAENERQKQILIAQYDQKIEESDDTSEEQDQLLVTLVSKRASLEQEKNKLKAEEAARRAAAAKAAAAKRAAAAAAAAGIGVSVAAAFLGISLTTEAVICIWVVAIVLLLFRVRYLCFAYAIGILGVIQFVVGLFSWSPDGLLKTVKDTVAGLDIPALLALVAVLHLAEALLIRLQGASFANPLFIEGKRGKLVGGYQMQVFWPIPLFLLIPGASDTVLPWTPLFGGDGWSGGFSMMALPVVIGFSEMTQSLLPQVKADRTFKRLLIYGVVLLAFSILSAWWSPLALVAALIAFVLHEGLAWYSRYEEQHRSPVFVHVPAAGDLRRGSSPAGRYPGSGPGCRCGAGAEAGQSVSADRHENSCPQQVVHPCIA
ncbi:hypothetical protein [Paenibacillus sp. AR247]|uniref:coiled-coil domain-containing protein n=1 Tax=Paenibacillus sp. AR247 TaxID=1631599 RepID=UPI000CF9AE52|nr:hypothetical protein [Paenibacillus sp. AR247]PQP87283.1 hypothetical protein CPT76_24670 [Paenibacillus sp. AR247]